MTLRWMGDAAYPPDPGMKLYCAALYIGGNTPHIATPAEWSRQHTQVRLPIFTASNREDTRAAAITDAATIEATLHGMNVPQHVTVAIDIETRVYHEYLLWLQEYLARWWLMVYGSVSTLPKNPVLDGGRWGAHWTDDIETAVQAIESGQYHAFQWANAAMINRPYDLSVISSEIPLWHV